MSELKDQRRLFIASPSIAHNPSDFKIFDEERLTREADRSGMVQRTQTGRAYQTEFGLPVFQEMPRVRVALKNKPLDFYGFDRWVMSNKAKKLLEALDPDAFAFVECNTSSPPRHSVDKYWLGKVRRVVDDFDRAASNFDLVSKQYDPGFQKYTFSHAIKTLNELVLLNGSERALAFYLLDYTLYPIFDGRLVDAIREAGLRGLTFSPLHAPRKGDVRTRYIKTYKHWKALGAI